MVVLYIVTTALDAQSHSAAYTEATSKKQHQTAASRVIPFVGQIEFARVFENVPVVVNESLCNYYGSK